MKSTMQHQFSRVPEAEIQRSSFDRSHGLKTTFDAGYLIPILVDEALPGDTFNLRTSAFARLATPLKPIMDNLFMDTFFFAVPYRLVWDNWERFNGAQDNPEDETDFLIPQVEFDAVDGGAIPVGGLYDYFGLPTGIASTPPVSALWGRSYNLIWNSWFRDQNLQDSFVFSTDDGPDSVTEHVLIRRGKRHDYFTSCLPFPQKGPDVLLPLGDSAPIVGTATPESLGANAQARTAADGGGGAVPLDVNINDLVHSGVAGLIDPLFLWVAPHDLAPLDVTGLTADLSAATAATINSIREAFQVQRLYERDARGGTRYTEIVRSHFGVTSPDARLQRPEYLGGGSTPVNLHPVAQTQAGVVDSPQGNLAAFGTASFTGHGFTKSFTEHCLIIGLVSVRADLTYQQGVNRMWSRRTRFDFFWPALAHLGEQAVLNKEIYMQTAADPDNDLVFGYQERFAEYRYKPSIITGKFRSTYSTPLDYWHLAQEFSSLPELNELFIREDPPIDRVIAVADEPHFLFDAYFNYKCARPMPVYGVPGMIDHF